MSSPLPASLPPSVEGDGADRGNDETGGQPLRHQRTPQVQYVGEHRTDQALLILHHQLRAIRSGRVVARIETDVVGPAVVVVVELEVDAELRRACLADGSG